MQKFLDTKGADETAPLHCAAKNGRLDDVRRLVFAGANLNAVDHDGKTAFDLGKNHIEVASYLGYTMGVNFQDEEKYEDAKEIYEKLLEIQEEKLGCDHPETTKTRNYIGSLQAILYATGLSDKKPPATYSLKKDLEAKNDDGRTPLHCAAKNGYLDIVRGFVRGGANPNAVDNDGKTAFDLGKNHVEVASYLGHTMGASFQDEKKYEDAREIYEKLLEIQEEKLGCDHPETTKTRNYIGSLQAILYATGLSDKKPPATYSLKKDLEAKDDDGRTPLHCAAKNGCLDIVRGFVRAGANPNAVDNDGKTAFDLGKNHVEVASYLGHTMGTNFQDEEKYEEAKEIYENLLEIQEEKLGCDHLETTKTRNYADSMHIIISALDLSDKD